MLKPRLIPVLLFVSLITFTLMHLTPGGPWDKDKPPSAQAIANLTAFCRTYLRIRNPAVRGPAFRSNL